MDRSEAGKKGFEKTGHLLDAFREEKSRQVRAEYESNPKFCLFCGEKIPFEKRANKFCSHSCCASHNNRGVTRHIKRSKFCSCGNPKTLQNKYCAECAAKQVYREKVTVETAKSDRVRKALLMEIREYRCEICGCSEWMGQPIPLELDHIDGDSDNNSEDNLRLICPNCHAQTKTYKGANMGKNSKRQIKRRKRYLDGKTY